MRAQAPWDCRNEDAVHPAPSRTTASLPFAADRSANGLLVGLLSRRRSVLQVGHLDAYVAAVVRELKECGVLTCAPQRTGSPGRAVRSVVLDCTALRIAAAEPAVARPGRRISAGGAIAADRAGPVCLTWDERDGWSATMGRVAGGSAPRYLHPELVPLPVRVRDFVVGLSLGTTSGVAWPVSATAQPPSPRPRGVGR